MPGVFPATNDVLNQQGYQSKILATKRVRESCGENGSSF
jgi:hypothetical protein